MNGDRATPLSHNEALLKTLKQLIVSFEPHIREAGSWDQAEDVLLHLEENDSNFHRYDFVKLLKKHISDNLGDLVSGEIDKYSTGHHEVKGQGPLVSQIADHVINSKQFRELFRGMKISLTDTANKLLRNFDSEFCTPLNTRENSFQGKLRGPHFCSDEEDESLCFNSLNQGSLVFLSADYLNTTVNSLSKSHSSDVRKEAMHSLNQIPVVDIAGSDKWKALRKNLLDVLSDSDSSLAVLGMKFVTRAFSSTTPKTNEIFTLLVDHILSQFTSKKNALPKVTMGINTAQPDTVWLIKAFRLINEFQKEAPTYWVRYPERFMYEVITGSLKLYSPNSQHALTPLHFISLLDPTASWFIKWMHAKYGREPLLEKLHSYKPILESAIRSCLRFGSFVPAVKSPSSISSSGSTKLYQEAELQYTYFIHSIHLLGQLLLYSNGRSFFPFHLPDEHDAVTIRDIVLCIIRLITTASTPTQSDASSDCSSTHSLHNTGTYEPSRLATDIIKSVCREEVACKLCVCKDEVIQALTQPVHQAISKSSEAKRHRASEGTMLQIADILSMIASTTDGRNVLLYGEGNTIHNRSRSAAAHVIAQFTRKALRHECKIQPSSLVVGDFLYICRQLYSTCEGLVVLHQYGLHDCVTKSLIQVKDEIDRGETPTPSDSGSDQTLTNNGDTNKTLQWEETLRDNLLNFASTAKGLLLLQQTGTMIDCVFYMFTRYASKLQMSKCEKFGYGCMVTQVATTAPGMLALHNAGFLKALIDEAWVLLEYGPYDVPSFVPKVWPVDPIDRHVHKPLIRLLNVLSSFPGVYEVLKGKTLANKAKYAVRDTPNTITDLVDRLMIVSSESRVQSLSNYEQSHVFGLRLLSVMISCLDTFLLLESQYKFMETFTTCQKDNTANDRKQIIVDVLSVERNYILVKSFMIGGPTERILPPRDLAPDTDHPYPHPMFTSTPIPKIYSPGLATKTSPKQENEVTKFLVDFRKKGEKDGGTWLEKCREAFAKSVATQPLANNVVQNLLDQAVTVLSKRSDQTIFPHLDFSVNDKALKTITLSPLQQLGVKVASRYGVHLKLVSGMSECETRLTKLITISTLFLHRQIAHIKSDLNYLQGPYPGFDWFATTVYLMMGGNVERTWRVLHKISTLSVSAYLWPARLHASVHLPVECAASGISPLFYRTAHNIELVLQSELPLVSSAFRMSGYTPAQICMSWLRQCFWNYLDWTSITDYILTCLLHGVDYQICISWLRQCFWNYLDWTTITDYILTCLLHGVDYQVYICVAILRHLRVEIARHTQQQDLIVFLKEEPIRDFKFAEHLEYMKSLENKFRRIIVPEMLNFSKI